MVKAYKTHGCTHDDAQRVFKASKCTSVWAGAKDELLDHGPWALVISAVGYREFTESPLSGTQGARVVLPESIFNWQEPPCVGIAWPDRGVPVLDRNWWASLAKAFPGIKGDIGLCCLGGHGRTGTMLAILASLLGKVKKGECPVDWVRERYCTSAVESERQLDYVERITGRKVFAEPSDAVRLAKAGTQVWGGLPGAGAHPGGALPGGASTKASPLAWKPPEGAAGVGDRSQQNPTPPPAITTGSHDGVVVGDHPTDDDLMDAWFGASGDVVTTVNGSGKRACLVPCWDNAGECIGWRTATDLEVNESV